MKRFDFKKLKEHRENLNIADKMIDSPGLNDFPINTDLSEIARVDYFLFPDPFKDIRNSGYPYKDHEATCFKCGKKYISMCYFKNI